MTTLGLIQGYLTSAERAMSLVCRAFLSPAWMGILKHKQTALWPLSELNALETEVFRAGGVCCVVPDAGLGLETTLEFLIIQTRLELTM